MLNYLKLKTEIKTKTTHSCLSVQKAEDLTNNELKTLPVCDDRFIKTKITTYDDKVYTYFNGLNLSLLHLFLLIIYLFLKTNIISKYIQTITLIKL